VKTVAEILRHVGEPPPVPFAPAPFQRAALDALAGGDVLVSAPTGSGKTWIAEQEIARVLASRDGAPAPAPAVVLPAAVPPADDLARARARWAEYGLAAAGAAVHAATAGRSR